jgi:hypothetical protein
MAALENMKRERAREFFWFTTPQLLHDFEVIMAHVRKKVQTVDLCVKNDIRFEN